MRRPTFVARHRLSLVLVFGHCLTLALYPKHPRLVVVEGKPLGERRALLPPLGVGRRGRGEEGEREEQRGPSSGRISACPPAVRPTRDLSRFARMNVAITPRYSSSAAMRSAGASVVRVSNSRSASIGYARPISIRILPSASRRAGRIARLAKMLAHVVPMGDNALLEIQGQATKKSRSLLRNFGPFTVLL